MYKGEKRWRGGKENRIGEGKKVRRGEQRREEKEEEIKVKSRR